MPVLLMALGLVHVACDDFAPATRIESARVIAVISEPPQALLGTDVTLRAIVASEQGLVGDDEVLSNWFLCADQEAQLLETSFICDEPDARQVLGNTPTLTTRIPADFLPDLDDNRRGDPLLTQLFGRYFTAHHEGIALVGTPLRKEESVKRVVVVPALPLAETAPRLANFDVFYDDNSVLQPNQNPVFLSLEISDAGGAPIGDAVAPGSVLTLAPIIDAASIESYQSLATDLSVLDLESPSAIAELSDAELNEALSRRQRCEVPTFSWFVTVGNLQNEVTVFGAFGYHLEVRDEVQCAPEDIPLGIPDNQLVLPAANDLTSDEVHVFAVLRDGRGGVDVVTRSFFIQ
ncbi:MAG: hypothetical protein GY822_04035 [Deltaproteobacteria bacterium]|nr:hypothetical protein [Deltaproteobacteria bacterium]